MLRRLSVCWGSLHCFFNCKNWSAMNLCISWELVVYLSLQRPPTLASRLHQSFLVLFEAQNAQRPQNLWAGLVLCVCLSLCGVLVRIMFNRSIVCWGFCDLQLWVLHLFSSTHSTLRHKNLLTLWILLWFSFSVCLSLTHLSPLV